MTARIAIPNGWAPRLHQVPLWNYIRQGGKRADVVWHRRAGKDSTALNLTATEMMERVGVYWHMLPTNVQARKVVWNGIDRDGRRIIDQAFPKELRERTHNQEMLIELKNGSMWQLCGSDNYDALVGSNPVGVIFSEYSIADPAAWDFIRPILLENGGWAIFIYTPRGKNHGYTLHKMAESNPSWFCERLTVDDTFREDGSPVIPTWGIEEERESGMPEEKVLQEYYCSWDAGMEGAYFTKEMNYADEQGLHGHFPWNPDLPVATFWDIGMFDENVIGFFQKHPENGMPVLIDADIDRNKGLPEYLKLVAEKPYLYSSHNGPHDMDVTEWGTGKTRVEQAYELGYDFDILPKMAISEGINALRSFLKRCYMNTENENVARVKDAIVSYRREFDDKAKIWKDKPVHDWTSHPTDMCRYAATGFNQELFGGFESDLFRVKRALGG